MSEDAGAAGGFEVASAYVRVDADASTFEESLEGQIGGLDYVVKVPVVPDAGDFAAEVDAAVGESQVAVSVPVVPDTEGFQLLVDQAAEESKTEITVPVVPDTAGLPEEVAAQAAAAKTEIVVPVVPDAAGLTEEATAEASSAGEAAGAAFSERFAAAAEGANLFPAAGVERDAETAAEESATGFGSRFSSLLAGIPLLGGMIPGVEKEAAEAGAASGSSFMGSLKGIISGDLPVMETLLGAGFVAATAVMASKFQAAMELIHTQAGVAQSAIAGLSGGVLSLAGQVGESPDSLAAALYHVESSFQSVGISGQKALQLVQIAAEGARTGNADLVDVTNALDATIVSGVGGIHNYSQAMGALNAIVGTGDMTMQNLADAMGTGLMAAGKAYGQSIYEIGAALATLGDNNIRGAKAATDLRMAWQAVEAPLKTGIPVLNSLGISANQLAQELTTHGLTAALQEFVSHLEASHVPISQWGQIVTEVFGKRAGVGLQVLMDQLSRLQGKLPDIEHAASSFGSSWAATEQTASQHVHELEAGFEALMIRIGDGLLPAVNSFMAMITRNLPAIEHFATTIAHLIAPAVSVFFDGLAAILKVLFGPLKDVTLAVGGLTVALLALNAIADLGPFGWTVMAIAAVVELAGVIVKYHKEIFDTITNTWNAIAHFFAEIVDPLFKPVEKAFDDFKTYIVNGFDKWWASHGKAIEKVWSDAWTAMKTVFDAAWDYFTTITTAEWDAIMDVLKPGLDLLDALFKTVWASIETTVKTAWDVIAAAVKIALAGIESVVKVAWDLIEGLFTVALDLITGQWGKAWTDLQNTAEQVWNAIKAFFQTTWNAISALTEQVVNNMKSYLEAAWNDIKSGVVSAFDDVKNTIVGIWDDILSAIEAIVGKIKSLISDISGGTAIGAVGKVLSSIGLARGGMVPGPDQGRDTMLIPMRGGEGVLTPAAVRGLGGPAFIHAANAGFGRGFADGGIIPGGLSPYAAGQAAGSMYAQPGGSAGELAAHGINVTFQYFGTQYPTAEMKQAMMMDLAAAVGVS